MSEQGTTKDLSIADRPKISDEQLRRMREVAEGSMLLPAWVLDCVKELQQMRDDWAAIDKAAVEFSEFERCPHWTCRTHGDFDARVAVGCPECVRQMREELQQLKGQNERLFQTAMARGDR